MKTNNKLTDIEWTTCWMAIRYAMNRQTIASSTLPGDLVKAYYYRWDDFQKKSIVDDLVNNDKNHNGKGFGDPNIDRMHWLKFIGACDIQTHFNVKLIDNNIHTVFMANGRMYSLESYITNPHLEFYIPKESLLEIL